jgi:hypothetical protein
VLSEVLVVAWLWVRFSGQATAFLASARLINSVFFCIHGAFARGAEGHLRGALNLRGVLRGAEGRAEGRTRRGALNPRGVLRGVLRGI